jgi:transcriptional regulator with XRE-family HTH domain
MPQSKNTIPAQSDAKRSAEVAGQRARQLRRLLDQTLEEVGEAIGKSRATVANMERGQNMSLPVWRRLADHYGKPLDYFWGPGERGRGTESEGGAEVVYYGDALVLRDDDSVRREIQAIRQHVVRVEEMKENLEQMRKAADQEDRAVRERLLRLVEGIFSSRKK